MLDFDDIGRAEGRELGPKPGKGAVLHQCSGEADFDGLPGDVLPSRDAVKRKLAEDAPAPSRAVRCRAGFARLIPFLDSPNGTGGQSPPYRGPPVESQKR